MKIINILIIVILCLIPINPALALSIDCPTTSAITTNSVTITCIVNATSASSAWISYGGYPGFYKFRTDTRTVTGNFTQTITGIPLIAGSTNYYKGYITNSTGASNSSVEGNFTLPLVTQITDYNFNVHTEELAYNGLNISQTAITIPSVYTDVVGSIFWGIIFGFIFVAIWIRQEDVSIPSLLGLLIGAVLLPTLPAEWVSLAYSLTIISFAGIMYSLIKSKM